MSEVIHPPRGYCIGVFTGNGGTMIGPYATEDEAREALSKAEIVAVGAPSGWHQWCRSTTSDGKFCRLAKGHGGNWHDNGSVCWPTETVE